METDTVNDVNKQHINIIYPMKLRSTKLCILVVGHYNYTSTAQYCGQCTVGEEMQAGYRASLE